MKATLTEKVATDALIERITIRLNESQNYDNNGNPVNQEFNKVIEGCADQLEVIQANLFNN